MNKTQREFIVVLIVILAILIPSISVNAISTTFQSPVCNAAPGEGCIRSPAWCTPGETCSLWPTKPNDDDKDAIIIAPMIENHGAIIVTPQVNHILHHRVPIRRR